MFVYAFPLTYTMKKLFASRVIFQASPYKSNGCYPMTDCKVIHQSVGWLLQTCVILYALV